MDRFEDTSEPTAAPRIPAAAADARPPSSPQTLDTTSSGANPAVEPVAAGFANEGFDAAPPRPLPPMAFQLKPAPSVEMAPPPSMPPRVFMRSGPAFEPGETQEPGSASPAPETVSPPPPIDAVLSEIDAEAAVRSLTATEGVRLTANEPEHAPPSLGSLIPGAPRLEMPPLRREPSFASLQARSVIEADCTPIGTSSTASDAHRRSPIGRIVRIVAWIALAWLAALLLLICAYRFVNPPASMLMLQQWLSGQTVIKTWVPIDRISPNVVRAVIASEDARFCEHNGVDFDALRDAVADGNGSRGASTISMQVVKNLFLWSSRSYVRKAIEMPLTFVMEALWPKRRIMEVYLNIAEWGPGIFGIEAAARYRFRKPASHLSASEASLLAVALPNPRVRNPAKPGPGLQRLARVVQLRMRLAPGVRTSCVLPRRRN